MVAQVGESVVELPGGWLDAEGRRHRRAVIVPLSGREEELLGAAHGPSAQLVTAVLARCVRQIGEVPGGEDVVRSLSVGDRQTLLLRLREATFGPLVAGVATCAWEGCGARMDLDFRTTDVPIRRPATDAAVHEVVLTAAAAPDLDDGERRVRFRLPDGADQEAVSDLLETNPATAWRTLLGRCLVAIGSDEDPGAGGAASLTPRACAEIEQAMAAQAYGPELSLEATCPECGRAMVLPFDIRDFFFGELRTAPEQLTREVHYLAYHYSWSEAEILDMTRDRRQRYIEVLAEEIERLNDAVG